MHTVMKATIDGETHWGELVQTTTSDTAIFRDRRQFPCEMWAADKRQLEAATDEETTLYLMQIHPNYSDRSSGF